MEGTVALVAHNSGLGGSVRIAHDGNVRFVESIFKGFFDLGRQIFQARPRFLSREKFVFSGVG
jgi:hypothetical protein